MKKKKTVYYDSFDYDPVGGEIEAPSIDGNYQYINKGKFYRLTSTLLYRLVAEPIAFLYTKLVLREKYVYGARLPRGGYFLFSNHIEPLGDAFSPSISQFPRRVYVVVHPKNLAWGAIAALTPRLGAIPTPTDAVSARAFCNAIRERLSEGAVVTVYPEGHLWPGYTGLRPFEPSAADLPRMLHAPVYTATRVYKKAVVGHRSVIYIDGPFYPDESLGRREARERLISDVRATMEARLASATAEPVIYKKRTDNEEEL